MIGYSDVKLHGLFQSKELYCPQKKEKEMMLEFYQNSMQIVAGKMQLPLQEQEIVAKIIHILPFFPCPFYGTDKV